MSTLQRPRTARVPGDAGTAARRRRPVLRELASFGLVGTLGTVMTIGGANLLRGWTGPVLSTLVPTVLSTVLSYLAHRSWTFQHRDSDGSGREVAVFFTLNGIGTLIQVVCSVLVFYGLGLHDALSYNGGLIAGTVLASGFRYWSYKKWVFTTAVP